VGGGGPLRRVFGGGGGGPGVVIRGAIAVDTHTPCLRVLQHAHAAKPLACPLHYVGRPADSESASETIVSVVAPADSESASGAARGGGVMLAGGVGVATQ